MNPILIFSLLDACGRLPDGAVEAVGDCAGETAASLPHAPSSAGIASAAPEIPSRRRKLRRSVVVIGVVPLRHPSAFRVTARPAGCTSHDRAAIAYEG
jgi:hypothetical protein